MKLLAILAALLIFPAAAQAGPFGSRMGDAPTAYSRLKDADPDFGAHAYETKAIPKPHYSLKRYVLGFEDDALDRVVAFTDFENFDGRNAKTLYNELEAALAEKYGVPGAYGTREDSSDYRNWFAVWEKDLPDDLAKIYLSIRAASAGRLRVAIVYVYKNSPTSEEMQKRNREAL